MTARFERAWAKASRANLAASVGFLLALSGSQSAPAGLATVRAITNRLRRQKASLSQACGRCSNSEG
jgi:hypothetical protein